MASLILFSANACAFDSAEHKRLGDLSYHIALQTFCEDNNTPLCVRYLTTPSADDLFFDPLKDSIKPPSPVNVPSPSTLSYGDVVKCVDYFLTPEKLIGGREAALIRPPRAGLYPASRNQLDLDVINRCDDHWTNFEGARSGHVNHNHFQVEMLIAQRSNHAVALYLRAKEKKLFGALVMNAISDHYLHDSFAPGHITTWRNKMSDVIANSYHDFNNRNGLSVHVDVEQLREFAVIRRENGSVVRIDNILRLLGKGKAAEQFFMCTDKVSKCPENREIASEAEVAKRLEELKSFIQQTGSATEPKPTFKGDKQLWNYHQDIQRFVMLLSAIRSIHDVLESYPAQERVALTLNDSFEHNAWEWSEDEPGKHLSPVRPPTSMVLPPSTIKAKIGAVEYEVERRFPDAGESPSKRRIDNRGMDPIFGISMGIDNMTFGDSQNRRVLGLETVVTGLTIGQGRLTGAGEMGNFAIMAGVQGYTGPGPDGFGPTARFLWVHPATETSTSVQMRYLKIRPAGGAPEWHPAIGLRFDMGFTSFLTMYLRGGRDWAAQRDGTVRSGYSVGGGVQFGSAKCNIPGLKSVANCP